MSVLGLYRKRHSVLGDEQPDQNRRIILNGNILSGLPDFSTAKIWYIPYITPARFKIGVCLLEIGSIL
jgi:hypothetical protein